MLQNIALFDFDGTITTDDSLIKFIRFVVGDVKTLLRIGAIKMIPEWKFKGKNVLYTKWVWRYMMIIRAILEWKFKGMSI